MAVEFITCPTCKQKLALQSYVAVGALVVCANPKCGTSLRITQRKPVKVEVVPEEETHHHDYRPESYG